MNILYIYADSEDEWNCSEWRCAVPMRSINKSKDHHAKMISINDFILGKAREEITWTDILVVQRLAIGNTVAEMIYWKAHNIPVVVDLDDAYDFMTQDNQAFEFWINGEMKRKPVKGSKEPPKVIHLSEPPFKNLQWALKTIDGVTSPSKVICNDWAPLTKTYYVPNWMDFEAYQHIEYDHIDDKINVGWMGSHTHVKSFEDSGVLFALKRVVDRYPNVNIVLGGGDYRIYNAIKVPESRKSLAKWVPFKDYPTLLAQVDIGIAPLWGNYDDRRSYIKVLEYMAMGKVWIASNRTPYQEFAPYGTLVKNLPVDWYNGISQAIDEYPKRSKTALENMKVALDYAMDNRVEDLVAIYQTIIDEAKK